MSETCGLFKSFFFKYGAIVVIAIQCHRVDNQVGDTLIDFGIRIRLQFAKAGLSCVVQFIMLNDF